MSEQTAQILERALAKIDRPEKWGKGPARNRPGCLCVSEALLDACDPFWGPALNALHALPEIAGMPIPTWNDAPERTHADVVAAFTRAIEAERAS